MIHLNAQGVIPCDHPTADGKTCANCAAYTYEVAAGTTVTIRRLCRSHARRLQKQRNRVTPIALPSGAPLPAAMAESRARAAEGR